MSKKEVTIISKSEADAIRAKALEKYKHNLFVEQAEMGQKVKTILETEVEDAATQVKIRESIVELENEIAKLKDDKTKAARVEVQRLTNHVNANNLMATQLSALRNEAYKHVLAGAEKISDIKDAIEFYETFEGYVPQLPFIIVDGTKYESTPANTIKVDASGKKILYVENNKSKKA